MASKERFCDNCGDSMGFIDDRYYIPGDCCGLRRSPPRRHAMLDPSTTDRFVSPCAPPDGRTRELLICAAEECAEVTQRITKALRFGLDEVHPGQPLTNAQRIAGELGDLQAVVNMLAALDVLNSMEIAAAATAKYPKLDHFLQTPKEARNG
jgi:hypothetical protein